MSMSTGHVFIMNKVMKSKLNYSMADLITLLPLSVSKIRELINIGEFPASFNVQIKKKCPAVNFQIMYKNKSIERWDCAKVNEWRKKYFANDSLNASRIN